MPDMNISPNIADSVRIESACRVGLIGHGIQLSRTPKMHIDEGLAHGLDYQYDLIDTRSMSGETNIADLLANAEAEGYQGVNITHPYKRTAIPFLDCLSKAARVVGAVNTVVFRDGKRFGHNTDYWGFAEAFRTSLEDVNCGRVLLLGAGGAGSAVAHALIDWGVERLTIIDKDQASAEGLVETLVKRGDGNGAVVGFDLAEEISLADGIVNATPVGMSQMPGSPVPIEHLSADHWVADIIYFPLETEFLNSAKSLGCKVMDGSGMAVFQAVRAFELFTGLKPDSNRMRATFDAFSHKAAG